MMKHITEASDDNIGLVIEEAMNEGPVEGFSLAGRILNRLRAAFDFSPPRRAELQPLDEVPEADATPDEAFDLGRIAGYDEAMREVSQPVEGVAELIAELDEMAGIIAITSDNGPNDKRAQLLARAAHVIEALSASQRPTSSDEEAKELFMDGYRASSTRYDDPTVITTRDLMERTWTDHQKMRAVAALTTPTTPRDVKLLREEARNEAIDIVDRHTRLGGTGKPRSAESAVDALLAWGWTPSPVPVLTNPEGTK